MASHWLQDKFHPLAWLIRPPNLATAHVSSINNHMYSPHFPAIPGLPIQLICHRPFPQIGHTFPPIQLSSTFFMLFPILTAPLHPCPPGTFPLICLRFNSNDTLSLMPFSVDIYHHHICNPFRIQDACRIY